MVLWDFVERKGDGEGNVPLLTTFVRSYLLTVVAILPGRNQV